MDHLQVIEIEVDRVQATEIKVEMDIGQDLVIEVKEVIT